MNVQTRAKRLKQKRLFALLQKEIRQIFRDRQLLSFLIIPPVVQLLAYGFALSPQVDHLSLGVLDQSLTPISRELVGQMTANQVFDVHRVGQSEAAIAEAVRDGKINAAVIIPPNFARSLLNGRPAQVQVFLDAVDANTAGIAASYIQQIIGSFNIRLKTNTVGIEFPLLSWTGTQSQTQAQPTQKMVGSSPNPSSLYVVPFQGSLQPLPVNPYSAPLFNNTAPPPLLTNAVGSFLNGGGQGSVGSGNIIFVASDAVSDAANSFQTPVPGSAPSDPQSEELTNQVAIETTPQGSNQAVSPSATSATNSQTSLVSSIPQLIAQGAPAGLAGNRLLTQSPALQSALTSTGRMSSLNALAALEMSNSAPVDNIQNLLALGTVPQAAANNATQSRPGPTEGGSVQQLSANLIGSSSLNQQWTTSNGSSISQASTATSGAGTSDSSAGSAGKGRRMASPLQSMNASANAGEQQGPSAMQNAGGQQGPGAMQNAHVQPQLQMALSTRGLQQPIQADVSFLYNQGLTASWFFVPGVIGFVVTLTGTLVATIALVREKDSGTLEQLLMTPVNPFEILVAKILPLFVLVIIDFLFALALGQLFFNIPMRGSFVLLMSITALYFFVALSVGLILATISKNQRQALLTSFFFNLPLIQLSGAIAPIESMPEPMQYLALLDPLRYYVICLRAIMLKDAGLDALWPSVLALTVFAVLFLSGSIYNFRRQLG